MTRAGMSALLISMLLWSHAAPAADVRPGDALPDLSEIRLRAGFGKDRRAWWTDLQGAGLVSKPFALYFFVPSSIGYNNPQTLGEDFEALWQAQTSGLCDVLLVVAYGGDDIRSILKVAEEQKLFAAAPHWPQLKERVWTETTHPDIALYNAFWPGRSHTRGAPQVSVPAIMIVDAEGTVLVAQRELRGTWSAAAALEALKVGWIELRSDPPGAEVWLGGALTDRRTPCRLPLPAGEHRIELRLPGHRPAQATFAIVPQEALQPEPIVLEPAVGRLKLESDPAGAAVLIDGRETDAKTPVELEVPAGEHEVELRLEGRAPERRRVQVEAEQTLQLDPMVLRSNRGQIQIHTLPPGAAVSLGEARLGHTPEPLEVPPGQHRLRLELADHQPRELDVTVDPERVLVLRDVVLEPLPAALTIVTDPPGAEVRFNDVTVGVTPLQLSRPPGEWRLVVVAEGHQAWRQTLTTEPNQQLDPLRVELEPLLGRVRIETVPPGAEVSFRDTVLGTTPLTTPLPLGRQTLRLALPGYRPVEIPMEVVEGRELRVEERLAKARGVLAITSRPEGADIFIDDTPAGRQTPAAVEVDSERAVRVRVSKPGYEDAATVVDPRPGERVEVSVGPLQPYAFPPAGWPAHLAEFTPNPNLRYRVTAVDGMPQVFIPAGTFKMGDVRGQPQEQPVGEVYLDGYWIDLHEVTNEQYAMYLRATGTPAPPGWSDWARRSSPRHPAILLTWFEAQQYAAWAGKLLPSEAQWEKAARAGHEGRPYPWGSEFDDRFANGGVDGQGEVYQRVKPVASLSPNDFGLFDIIGNVSELCRDLFSRTWYERRPSTNPVNDDEGYGRVLRGGSWSTQATGYLRSAARLSLQPDDRFLDVGFRCVSGPDGP